MAEDQILMQRIYDSLGVMIAAACQGTAIPPAFVAALIANESGGDVAALRYEPAVFAELQAVITGRPQQPGGVLKAYYSPAGCKRAIGRSDLLALVSPSELDPRNPVVPFSTGLEALEDLASSHGLLQIMGWHTIEFDAPSNAIKTPLGNVKFAVQAMLPYFISRYNVVLLPGGIPGSWEDQLLRCWNTGRPNAPTYDPQYVPNGLNRMAIYQNIANAADLKSEAT